MKKKKQASSKFGKNRIITIGGIAAVIALAGFFGYRSLIPSNGTSPILAMPQNDFIRAAYDTNGGYVYVSQASGAVKGVRSNGGSNVLNPEYVYSKGALVSFHFTNEEYQTHSKHNFNIDAFNIHTKDLGYFGTETVNFVADKTGTFEYHCTIHPEMKGKITIQ